MFLWFDSHFLDLSCYLENAVYNYFFAVAVLLPLYAEYFSLIFMFLLAFWSTQNINKNRKKKEKKKTPLYKWLSILGI